MQKYGLGPGIIGRLNILPYSKLFYIASRTHDIGYERGGNDMDKMRVDILFYSLMKIVSKTHLQKIFAWIYYKIVLLFGHFYFNYKQK